MSAEQTDPPQKASSSDQSKPSGIWTTVFEINPEYPNFLITQRIVDSLRAKPVPHIDPKAAEEEAKELYGDDLD